MFQRGKGETCILQRSKASTNIHVYMSVCMHSLLFTKTCETHQLPAKFFRIVLAPKTSVRKIGLEKLPYTEHCLFPAYGKILPRISAFSVFLWSPFSGKIHHKPAETSKTSICMEDFYKIESDFFAGNSKILPVLRGWPSTFWSYPRICPSSLMEWIKKKMSQ